MTSSVLDSIFKRKRSERNSDSSSVTSTPERDLVQKKKTKQDTIQEEIDQESDSILVDLDDSLGMESKDPVVNKDLQGFLRKFEDTFTEKLKSFKEEVLGLVTNTLEQTTKDIEKLKKEVGNLQKENDTLKQEVAELKYTQQELRKTMNDTAQYTRKDNVRILGLDEQMHEDTREVVCSTLSKKLNIEVKPSDIAACHRLPSTQKNLPRPVIVRFKDRFCKDKVTKERRKLKGQKITICDDITRDNLKLMNRAKMSNLFESVWYFNGKVRAVKKSDAKKVIIGLFQDFSKV